MDKTTKTVLSLAILGAGGYLLYKNFKKPTSVNFATAADIDSGVFYATDKQKNFATASNLQKGVLKPTSKQKNLAGITENLNVSTSAWGNRPASANATMARGFSGEGVTGIENSGPQTTGWGGRPGTTKINMTGIENLDVQSSSWLRGGGVV